jgi:hypothetical protein
MSFLLALGRSVSKVSPSHLLLSIVFLYLEIINSICKSFNGVENRICMVNELSIWYAYCRSHLHIVFNLCANGRNKEDASLYVMEGRLYSPLYHVF